MITLFRKFSKIQLLFFYSITIVISISILNQSLLYAQRKDFKIKDTTELINVTANNYTLSIDKISGTVFLLDWQGIPYTSFPLSYAFMDEKENQSNTNFSWKIRDERITCSVSINNLTFYEVIIKCYKESFEIQYRISHPQEGTKAGILLFKNDKQGFDTTDWEAYFSPEPDDYFNHQPSVDLKTDKDQQWFFVPAPLNISFQSKPGWFSIGLVELPSSSVFAFRQSAIWLNIPWDKITDADQLIDLPTLVFTFNSSSWDAVSDYSNHLKENYLQEKKGNDKDEITGWWNQLFVSTWGEQNVQEITIDNPEFNSKWVKEYILRQLDALSGLKFTVIIEDKWAKLYGDPNPSDRFKDLRQLIDWCHEQGLKVVLYWKAWQVEAGSSAATKFEIVDRQYVDATHNMFEAYVDSCCQILFGTGEQQLNADGLKIDDLFLVRNPENAVYQNPSLGMGFKEVHRYLEIFYNTAKKYKPDALIMSTAIDPHYEEIQDIVRINDDWDNKTRREKRARIITQSMPNKLIIGDAADMSDKIAIYHYVTSSVYGIPAIYYLTRFQDNEISEKTKLILANIFRLLTPKPDGLVEFVNYGNWRILNRKNNQILAETIPSGKGIIYYRDSKNATFLCAQNSTIHIILENHELKNILSENNTVVPYTDLGHGIYELKQVEEGKFYQLKLKKVTRIRP